MFCFFFLPSTRCFVLREFKLSNLHYCQIYILSLITTYIFAFSTSWIVLTHFLSPCSKLTFLISNGIFSWKWILMVKSIPYWEIFSFYSNYFLTLMASRINLNRISLRWLWVYIPLLVKCSLFLPIMFPVLPNMQIALLYNIRGTTLITVSVNSMSWNCAVHNLQG